MATAYELKTISHGYQIGISKYFGTREEAERARKEEKAADKAFRQLCLEECGDAPESTFRYYIKKHEGVVLLGIHPKKST